MKLLTNLLPTLVFRIWISPWVSKQKNRLSEYIGKPYFMLFKAIILRLGKQKLVVAIKENYYAISFKTLKNQQVTFVKITVKLHSQ